MRGGKSQKAQPFSEHIRELRKRLIYSIAALLLGSIVGYIIHQRLFRLIRRPLHEQLYYTTPTGGFNAIIKISILFGLVVAVPVFVYHICRFLSPSFQRRLRVGKVIFLSIILAVLGVLFAYYVSLPSALHFLANIDTGDLKSLLTVNEYLNFVMGYIGSFALLFQLPLIMLFVNRIKPQRPGRLMRVQRWVILGSFVLAAFLTPTPDPINQALMAMPIILLYQFSVILIWVANRRHKKKAVMEPDPVVVMPAVESNPTPPVPSPAPVTNASPRQPVITPVRKPKLIMDIFWVPTNPML